MSAADDRTGLEDDDLLDDGFFDEEFEADLGEGEDDLDAPDDAEPDDEDD